MSTAMYTKPISVPRNFLRCLFQKSPSPLESLSRRALIAKCKKYEQQLLTDEEALGDFELLKAKHEDLQTDCTALKDENSDLLFQLESMEHDLKHQTTVAALLSDMKLIQALSNGDYEKAYNLIAGDLDQEGFRLYDAAEKYTGIDVCRAFPTEDNLGYFENADGFELLGWLETEAYGSCDWEQLNPPYERAVNRKINKDTPEYKEYRAAIYKQTVTSLLSLKTQDN